MNTGFKAALLSIIIVGVAVASAYVIVVNNTGNSTQTPSK